MIPEIRSYSRGISLFQSRCFALSQQVHKTSDEKPTSQRRASPPARPSRAPSSRYTIIWLPRGAKHEWNKINKQANSDRYPHWYYKTPRKKKNEKTHQGKKGERGGKKTSFHHSTRSHYFLSCFAFHRAHAPLTKPQTKT